MSRECSGTKRSKPSGSGSMNQSFQPSSGYCGGVLAVASCALPSTWSNVIASETSAVSNGVSVLSKAVSRVAAVDAEEREARHLDFVLERDAVTAAQHGEILQDARGLDSHPPSHLRLRRAPRKAKTS